MFEKITLKNGIRVLSEPIRSLDTASVGFWFNVGSANETKETNGYSHFIEHMLFKGTKKYSAFDIVKMIEGVGGNINAFTSRHFTAFYISILSTHIDRAFNILTDIIESSLFEDIEIEREKRVVLDEIRLALDLPEEMVSEQLFAKMFKGNPISMPIAGRAQNVKKISRQELIKHFKEYFTAKNLVVSIAGKYDLDKALQKIEAIRIPKGKVPFKTEKPKVSYSTAVSINPIVNQVYFCLVTEAFPSADNRLYALAVLNNILGGGSCSRLFQSLREKHGLCYNVYSYLSSFKNTGTFEIHGATNLASYEKALSLIREEIEKIEAMDISDEEIEDAKAMHQGALAFNKANADFIMNKNAKHEFLHGRHYTMKEMYDRIKQVSKEDICEVAKAIFGGKFFLSAVGPEGTDKTTQSFMKSFSKR